MFGASSYCPARYAARQLSLVKSQPNRNYVSNDDIQTPREMASRLMKHLRPVGTLLEPAAGDGAFLDLFPTNSPWCEVKRGRDFMEYVGPHVDWVITNPPWSEIRAFLQKSFQCADNVVFLMTINHAWTKARLRDAKAAGFGLSQIILLETPVEFPQTGFQLGAVHYQRGYAGPIDCVDLQRARAADWLATSLPVERPTKKRRGES
jgi:hypothetical protein